MCVCVFEKRRREAEGTIILFASSPRPPGGRWRGQSCVCLAKWMEGGLPAELDPTAEEDLRDLSSSVQSIMCKRPSL